MKKICFYLVAALAISAVLIAGVSSGALVRPTSTVPLPRYLKLAITDDTGNLPLRNALTTLYYTTAERVPYKQVFIQGLTNSGGEFVIPGSYFSGLSVRPYQELKGSIIVQGYVPKEGVASSNWASILIDPRPRTVKMKFKRALRYAPPAGAATVERVFKAVDKVTGLPVAGVVVQVRVMAAGVGWDTIIEGLTNSNGEFKYKLPKTTPPVRVAFSIAKPGTFGWVVGGLGSEPESDDPTNEYHPDAARVNKVICRLEKFKEVKVVE